MVGLGSGESRLEALVQAIVAADAPAAARLLAASPELVGERAQRGERYIVEIEHHLYVGDTALHIAAAAHRKDIALQLIAKGARVRAKNRRGAQPLHYAADGAPGSSAWSSDAQAATIACLIEAGADPNAVDNSGVAPLHRAVRTRCAAAVKALLEGGADARARNNNGSTPMLLARRTTGRGGSGSPEAKAQQEEILVLLEVYGAA